VTISVYKATSEVYKPIFPSLQLKPQWLRHVDLLFKIIIQKGGLHVKLIQLIIILCYKCQQNMNSGVLHNMREYLIVINTLSLSISLGYQPVHVAYNSIWRSCFLCKNSFATNGFLPFGQLNKFSSVVHMKRPNILHHSIFHNSYSELNSASLNVNGTLSSTTSTGSA